MSMQDDLRVTYGEDSRQVVRVRSSGVLHAQAVLMMSRIPHVSPPYAPAHLTRNEP